MSASVAFDGGSPGIRLASAGTNRASSEPCASTWATSCVLGGVGDVVAERLGEQLIRGGEILLAMPEQHARPAVERGPGRLGDQRGLAQTGLTRDQQHLAALAAGDPLERIQHRRRSRLRGPRHPTPDARPNGPAAARPFGVGPLERLPPHLDGLHRIGQALQHQRPDRRGTRDGCADPPSTARRPPPGSARPHTSRTSRAASMTGSPK